MSRENVTELLKNYRNYRCAIRSFENHNPMPGAGVADYSGMPGGSGAPELFFSPNGRLADMGRKSIQDRWDYQDYFRAVSAIEGGLQALSDDEQSIVKSKWMDGMTLQQIADRKGVSIRTIKSRHKSALSSLEICFRFVRPPQIEDIRVPGAQHHRYPERESIF